MKWKGIIGQNVLNINYLFFYIDLILQLMSWIY